MSQLDLTVGAEIPSFTRRQDFDVWNRYAAVNDEFVPIHMDDGAGQEAGFPGAIGMGNLSWAYLHNMLRRWLGEGGEIRKISISYRQPNLRQSTVSTHGKITGVSAAAGATLVELDLWVDDDAGRVLMNGQATVVVRSQ
jgi:acyl dehydratase